MLFYFGEANDKILENLSWEVSMRRLEIPQTTPFSYFYWSLPCFLMPNPPEPGKIIILGKITK